MQPTQRRLAIAIWALALDAVVAANSGHPGMPLGMADAATALFTKYLKFYAGYHFSILRFKPVTTTKLRLVAQLKPGMSSGILEWRLPY
jgi:hypothetical protein